MKIYSLVRISYDWYEFQDFMLSTTKKEKIYEAEERLRSEYEDWEGNPLKIYFQDNKADAEISAECREPHWRVYVNEE